MRPIGYVVHVRTPGSSGGGARSYQVAQALGVCGADVHLYGGVSTSFGWVDGVHPHPLKHPAPLGLAQLACDFSSRNIGVAIERYHLPPFNIAFFAQQIRRKPVILEVHSLPIEEMALVMRHPDLHVGFSNRIMAQCPRATWERLQSAMFRRVDHFITTSAGTREILTRLGVPPDRISVIYNCVDPTLFDPTGRDPAACRRALGLPGGGKIVVYAGSLHREGLSTIAETASMVTAARRLVHFVCAVVGPTDALADLARSRGLSPDQFSTMPPIPHERMPDLLAAADVVLAPYNLKSELFRSGFHYSPLKVMEALAMKKTVVTVDACELRRVFGGVANLQFARSGHPESWAECVIRALDSCGDPALEQGRSFVMDGYRWQDAALKYLDIVRTIEERKA